MSLDPAARQPSLPPKSRDTVRSAADGRRFAVCLLLLLLAGLVVRAPFLPRLGQAYDMDLYRSWMGAIQDHGLDEVYTRTDADYVGYLYLLWATGEVYDGHASQVTIRDKELRLWLKLPGLVGDLLGGVLIAGVARSLARSHPRDLTPRARALARRLGVSWPSLLGLGAAALTMFHPTLLYASSYWGQQDLLVACFMLAAVWLAVRRQGEAAAVTLALGVLVKPQPLVLGPLLALLIWRRNGPAGLLRAGTAGLAVLALGHVYFVLTGHGSRVLDIYMLQIEQTEHLSYSAYNLWWPAERLWSARPNGGFLGLGGAGITYGVVATLLVLAVLVWAGRRLVRAPDSELNVFWTMGAFLAAYYLCASAVHERYIIFAIAFLVPVVASASRSRLPVLLLSVTTALNLLIALPMDRRWQSGDPVWLTIVLALATTAAVLWLMLTPPTGDETRAVSAVP